MKLLQINVTANWGSTGKIAENIGQLAIANGWESYIAYGRGKPQSNSRLIRIGNDWDMRFHVLQTRFFDNHGLTSKKATNKLIDKIKLINPDVIHLHNLHGYYLNYPLLFEYLRRWGGPVVWTLHDVWPITGHCAFLGTDECEKWKSGCGNCNRYNTYPISLIRDRSHNNFLAKQRAFQGLPNLTLVPVSNWLSDLLKESILSDYPIRVIHNGIDTGVFYPHSSISPHTPYILGVANIWESRKGLDDFIKLRKILPKEIGIKLVGLTDVQIQKLPPNIIGIKRTQSIDELSVLYNNALAYVNPTWDDNFPTTNLEALSCGTPVITYNTGGSVEAINSDTGIIVNKGDIVELKNAVLEFHKKDRMHIKLLCRYRAITMFRKEERFKEYFELYDSISNGKTDHSHPINYK